MNQQQGKVEKMDEVADDITTVIARLQRMQNELTAEIESLNQRIDELKRTREIVLGMKGNESC